MITTSVISPNGENMSFNDCSLTDHGRLPTYNFFLSIYLMLYFSVSQHFFSLVFRLQMLVSLTSDFLIYDFLTFFIWTDAFCVFNNRIFNFFFPDFYNYSFPTATVTIISIGFFHNLIST